MDVHDKATRSLNMSRIRSKGTKPELRVIEACRTVRALTGRRFWTNVRKLPGKPDIVFPRSKVAIFVNGCFWHSHDCRYGRVTPKTNSTFWSLKRSATITRDAEKTRQLVALGYDVHVIWECDTYGGVNLATLVGSWVTPG